MSITPKRLTGDIGESIAVKFLMKHGHTIIDRNYLRKWGEIDVISNKSGVLHFVEVKTSRSSVIHETNSSVRPEENIHPAKLGRMYKTIQTYLLEKSYEGEWQVDALIVTFSSEEKKAKVRLIENIAS